MSVYAIGDLQGCVQQALDLTKKIRLHADSTNFYFVGDLVNRGPDSLATLRFVRSLKSGAALVLGNHDLHLLALAGKARQVGSHDTLHAILDAPDADDMINWLRHQPLAIFEDNHLFVHAGVLPQWTVEQTLALAHEVEHVLRGPYWVDFLREMYGNTPAKWHEDLQGTERLRCIVNALTRVRYCEQDGTMVLNTPENVSEPVSGILPWFDLPDRKTLDVTVVFGHWSQRGLVLRSNLIGLDTGCVWGGKLTAICLSDRKLLQVDCPRYQMPS
jgi:bis(5'-nucleosyl)-tetraphosphatase (symmetrical)